MPERGGNAAPDSRHTKVTTGQQLYTLLKTILTVQHKYTLIHSNVLEQSYHLTTVIYAKEVNTGKVRYIYFRSLEYMKL